MNLRRFLIGFLLTLAILLLLFAISQMISYGCELKSSQKLRNQLFKECVQLPQKEEAAELETEQAPIQVDFDKLNKIYPNVVGWLYCPDTPINYPVAQSEDNVYYLRRLLNGRYNINGTLFVDYVNSKNFTDWNTIIYGHNMINGTMFTTLLEYKDQAYYENHPTLYLLTPEADYKIELVAGAALSFFSDVYSIPGSEKERNDLLKLVKSVSTFQSGYTVRPEDKLITLSTCSYENKANRYVVIGALCQLKNKDTAQDLD